MNFIKSQHISIREFEEKTGLANGTINNYKKRGADLTSKNVERIAAVYKTELAYDGYAVVDLAVYGREGMAIVVNGELPDVADGTISASVDGGVIELLSRALADQAEAAKIQAAANDKYATGFMTLAGILERIESKMAQADAQAIMADSIDRMESNLKKGMKNQDLASGIVAEILDRSVRQESGGNEGKRAEILDSIAKKIGPDSLQFLQTGRRPDQGN